MKTTLILVAGNLVLSILGLALFRENRMNHKLRDFEILNFIFFGMLFLLISLLHITEIKIDPVMTSKFSLDFTRLIYNMEGNIVAFFQSWTNPFLDYYMVFMYIFGFSFPSSTPDFAIMQKAIERCLGIATQRQRSYFQNKIIKDSWTATIDKMIPKGSIITEEATEAFTNELMSKLQPYIMRIME